MFKLLVWIEYLKVAMFLRLKNNLGKVEPFSVMFDLRSFVTLLRVY